MSQQQQYVTSSTTTTTTTTYSDHNNDSDNEAFDSPNGWAARAHEMSMMSVMEGTLVSKEKALPAVLQWLANIYEVHKGQATPKREVYADYLAFCRTNCIEPTNAPAFGKILRMVFPDITSRRLGRRGHTSHHYNHFRRKATAPPPNTSAAAIKTEADGASSPYPMQHHAGATNGAGMPMAPLSDASGRVTPHHVLIDNNHNNNGHPGAHTPLAASIVAGAEPYGHMNGAVLRYPTPQPHPGAYHDNSMAAPIGAPQAVYPQPGYPQTPYGDPSAPHMPLPQQPPQQSPYWPQQQQPQQPLHHPLTLSASHQQPGGPYTVQPQMLAQHVPPTSTGHISPHMLSSSTVPSTATHPSGPAPITMPPAPHGVINSTPVAPSMSNPLPATVPTVLPGTAPAQSSYESSLFKSLLSSPDFTIEGTESLTPLLTDFDPRVWRADIPMVVSPETVPKGASTLMDTNLPQPTEPGKVPLFTIDSQQLPLEELKQEARHFTTLYRNHYQTLLDALQNSVLDFEAVYTSLFLFWPQAKTFHSLLSAQSVIEQILNIDAMMYSSLLGLILPNLFAEVPAEQLERIYVFSRSFTGWLRDAMAFNIPYTIYEYKLKVADSFCRGLFTRASINRLSQILRMHLANEHSKPLAMHADWEKIDFNHVNGQTWLYGEFRKIPLTIKEDVPKLLSQEASVEDWARWVREVCENVMKGVYAPLTLSVPEFLLKWSIYTNLITSYLTLQRATSLDGYLALFTWMDAMFTHCLEEQEQQRVRRARAQSSRSSISASMASFFRRNSLPGTSSFSTPGLPGVGNSLIPSILAAAGDDDEFSGF